MCLTSETDMTLTGEKSPEGRILGVMAKYWTAGAVKTRLGSAVGNNVSAALHRQFVIHLCERLATVAERREIVVSPSSTIPIMQSCLPTSWRFRPQSDGDLGERMRNWFDQAFQADGFERAILIGADCPNLKPSEIETSFELLETHSVVLGPANDGGYYLIGIKNPAHFSSDHLSTKPLSTELLFNEMIWSRNDVFETTQRRIRKVGLSLALLPKKSDVDEIEDLRNLQKELQVSRESDALDGELADEINRLLAGSDLKPISKEGA